MTTGNLLGVVTTVALDALVTMDKANPNEKFPTILSFSNIFVLSSALIANFFIFCFNGENRRLAKDQESSL